MSDLSSLPLDGGDLDSVRLTAALEVFRSLETTLSLHMPMKGDPCGNADLPPPLHGGGTSGTTMKTGTVDDPMDSRLPRAGAAAELPATGGFDLLIEKSGVWAPQVWRMLGIVRRKRNSAEPSGGKDQPSLSSEGDHPSEEKQQSDLSRLQSCACSCAEFMVPHLSGSSAVTEVLEKGMDKPICSGHMHCLLLILSRTPPMQI